MKPALLTRLEFGSPRLVDAAQLTPASRTQAYGHNETALAIHGAGIVNVNWRQVALIATTTMTKCAEEGLVDE